MMRLRNVLADHPFTILGTSIGVIFALLLWLRLDSTDREVQKIRDRVVVIERNIKNGKKQSEHRFVCKPSKPDSRGCRELRALMRQLSPAERRKVQKGLDRAKHKHTTSTRPHKQPSQQHGQVPSTPSQPTPASPPSGGGQPEGGGSSSDDPSDRGVKVQVQTDPPRVEVRTPKISVQTPVITVEAPSSDIVVQPPLP